MTIQSILVTQTSSPFVVKVKCGLAISQQVGSLGISWLLLDGTWSVRVSGVAIDSLFTSSKVALLDYPILFISFYSYSLQLFLLGNYESHSNLGYRGSSVAQCTSQSGIALCFKIFFIFIHFPHSVEWVSQDLLSCQKMSPFVASVRNSPLPA